MPSELIDLLNSPSKGVERVNGLLPKLFRSIISDLNLGPAKFNTLMQLYLNNPRNGFSNDPKRRSSERSNLMKEINRQSMTFKVFLKCVCFLAPESMDIEVRLNWGKRTTVHTISRRISGESAEKLMFENDEIVEIVNEEPDSPDTQLLLPLPSIQHTETEDNFEDIYIDSGNDRDRI